MVQPDSIAEAEGTERPGDDPSDNVVFIIDDDIAPDALSASTAAQPG